MKMKERVEKLAEHRRRNEGMGGPERVERQRAKGKLDARSRMKLLFDPGTFEELGLLAAHHGNLPEEEEAGKPSSADGVITGTGEINGRPVAAAIYDFTVFGGSIGEIGERKVARLRDLALKNRIPMVWLVDSAGARLDASAGIDPRRIAGFADTGYLFREQVVMSGVIPQVAAMMGPGAAGTAYIPALADFIPMVKGTSSIAIGGPYLVESVVGEKVTDPRCTTRSPAWRMRSMRTTRRASRRCASTCPSSPRTARRSRRAARRRTRSIGGTTIWSTWCQRARDRPSTCTRSSSRWWMIGSSSR
jgi:acetyl-CoA carboxylase carboxyltransferase component